jgi:transcription initiation factor TFIIIB Brf1 subunit/transcription initiation factor TFIIB
VFELVTVDNLSPSLRAFYIKLLQISPKTQKLTERILLEAENAGLTAGRTPKALVAGALYIACILTNEPKTLAKISKAIGVSLNTVQKNKTELVRKLGIRKTNSDWS